MESEHIETSFLQRDLQAYLSPRFEQLTAQGERCANRSESAIRTPSSLDLVANSPLASVAVLFGNEHQVKLGLQRRLAISQAVTGDWEGITDGGDI